MSSFESKVRGVKLTKTNRAIAEYCLSNLTTVPFLSVADLAERIGVSDVSIVRFARALGYSGYVELRSAWQAELCQHIESDASAVNPVARFITRKNFDLDRNNFSLSEAEEIYVHSIHDTFAMNGQATIETAGEKLYSSRRKYIIGLRTRASAAISFSITLRMQLSDVIEITSEDYTDYMRMLDFGPEDCVLFFTFGRYSVFEQLLLQRVKESGAYLIVVTDKHASKAALASDLLLYSAGDINLPFYSSVSNIVLAECISCAISAQHWSQTHDRIDLSEQYLNKLIPKK